jgi:hypothetical protein
MADEWYELDSGAAAAIVTGGLFVLPVGGSAWVWHARGSDGWDAIHQRIYRNHGADRLARAPAGAPPLPDPGPAFVVHRDDPGAFVEHPRLVEWIGQQRAAFLTLAEDTYESRFGDGQFLSVVGCFPDEAAARECELPRGNERHVRRVELSVVEGRVVAVPERNGFADRFEMSAVLADLVGRI